MKTPSDLKRYQNNWLGEVESASLYQILAKSEKNQKLSQVYENLASVELRHAKFWESKILEAGGTLPRRKINFRTALLGFLARKFGPGLVLPMINALETSDVSSYDHQEEAKGTTLPRDERSHARIIQALARERHGMKGEAVAKLEGRHRGVGGNALRAAILGANDGLVSNLSLITGIAGANFSNIQVLVSGLAGILAGACSMAMGEWLSVQSSRELYEKQIAVEAQELNEAPEEEAKELALIYEAKGISREEAERLANQVMKDREKALETLAREELGIDPATLGGSAWEAAGTSFMLFALGAMIPVIPLFFFEGSSAIPSCLVASALGLFMIGSLTALFTGRGFFFSGLRQLGIGLAAAAVTFFVGRWIGISL
ncbi:MAG: VIT1/CCC1 transporter family protein [Candidatus Omnitrophica bacterium]|nr:VIT1/CCC1 transporter family protein [Candidatus Omnitrophota bacterium]